MYQKKLLHLLSGIFILVFSVPLQATETVQEKIYVAVEGEGAVAVFDSIARIRLRTINLSSDHDKETGSLAPHNVQVAPDGQTVWVSVNRAHQKRSNQPKHGEMEHTLPQKNVDEIIVIDPFTDKIIRHIPIASEAHLAHVVLTPNSQFAYVSAQNEGKIYKINAKTFQIEDQIHMPPGSQPHGFRISADGSHAYIALLKGKGLADLDLKSNSLNVLPLNGAAVQTAATPDGRTIVVSLYDTMQLAVFDVIDKSIKFIYLPSNAKGPVQLYPTPDSHYVYVADQGHYFEQPDSHWLFKVDLQQLKVVKSIKAGSAPHGIVVSKDGLFAYVTNLTSDDLSIIDLKTDREIARIPVGREPNGISIWNQKTGGTP